MRITLLVILSFLLFFSSCTIQKRTFRSGYYISWNKAVKKTKPEERTPEKEEVAVSPVQEDTLCSKEPQLREELAVVEETSDSVSHMEQPTAGASEQPAKSQHYSETALTERLNNAIQTIQEKKYPKENDRLEEPERKALNLFALNAFVFAIGYLVLIVVAFDQGGSWTPVLAVICLFVAVGLAITALVKWKRNRSGFWGTFFALMALILLALGSLVFFVYAMANSSFG